MERGGQGCGRGGGVNTVLTNEGSVEGKEFASGVLRIIRGRLIMLAGRGGLGCGPRA